MQTAFQSETGSETQISAISEKHQHIFTKVWQEVERIIDEFSSDLSIQLGNPWIPLDKQEKTIKYVC
jgi:hypothetical protein